MCRSKAEAPPSGRRCPGSRGGRTSPESRSTMTKPGGTRPSGTGRTRRPLTPQNVEDVVRGVRQARVRVAAEEALDGASKPLLTAAAKELGAKVSSRHTAAQIRAQILDRLTPAAPATATRDVEDAVRSAYGALARRPQGWVSLTDLRQHSSLQRHDRAAVDAALIGLERSGAAAVVPEDDQQRLTSADREAALAYGGERLHRILLT